MCVCLCVCLLHFQLNCTLCVFFCPTVYFPHTKSPMQLIRGLRHTSKQFRHGRQEDAHEYARCLLESCQKEGTSGRKNSHQLNAKEIIRNVFGGKLCSQVKCLASSCNHISNTFDPILDLSLEITRASTLTKALQRFTAVEYLDGENKYECEKCRARVRASKRFWIESPPNILTIHLKRFEFGAYGRKIDKHIKFPTVLDLTPYMRAPGRHRYEYNLYAVLVHAGHSTHSGHYYSFIRAPSGLWHAMDDNHVRQVGENVVLQQRAYMLFYVRKVQPSMSHEQRQTTKKNQNGREQTASASADKPSGAPSSSMTTTKAASGVAKKQRDENGGLRSTLPLDVHRNGNGNVRLTSSPKHMSRPTVIVSDSGMKVTKSNGVTGNLKPPTSPPLSKAESNGGRHTSDTKESPRPTNANGGDHHHQQQHLLAQRSLHSARRAHGMNGSSPLSASKALNVGRGIFNLQNLVRQFLRRKQKLRRLSRRSDKVLSPIQKRRSLRLELKNLMRFSKAGGGATMSNGGSGGGSTAPGPSPSGAGAGFLSQPKSVTPRRELSIGAGSRRRSDKIDRNRSPPPYLGPSHYQPDDVAKVDVPSGEPSSSKMRPSSETTKMITPAKKRRRDMVGTSGHTANVLSTDQWEDVDTLLKATADGLNRRGAPKAKVIDEWDAEYDRGKQRKVKRRETGDDPDAEAYKAAVKALNNPFQSFSSGKRSASKGDRRESTRSARHNSRAAANGRHRRPRRKIG